MKGNNMQKGNAITEMLMIVALICVIGTTGGMYLIEQADKFITAKEVCK